MGGKVKLRYRLSDSFNGSSYALYTDSEYGKKNRIIYSMEVSGGELVMVRSDSGCGSGKCSGKTVIEDWQRKFKLEKPTGKYPVDHLIRKELGLKPY